MPFNRIFSDPNALVPTTAYNTAWSPAGLVIRPKERSDLVAVARTVLVTERSIPNNRIVLDVRHWQCPLEASGLRESLQRLANQTGVTFWTRTDPQIFLEEIEPDLKRALDAAKGPFLAMPGIEMGMHLLQSLRQEMRLELSLSIVMEQQQIQRDEREGFYDDLWTIERVPAEVLQINDLLCTMAKTGNPIEYLRQADSTLDRIQAIREPYFRMMAICHLAEELKHHPTLDFYVKHLFSGPLTANFNATPIVDQPALALMVAASQVRVGSDRTFVQNLVTRALGLAEERRIDFRGNDTRNLHAILSSWPSTIEEAAVAKGWVDRFVAREEWLARPQDLDLEAAESSLELSEERQAVQPGPESEPPPPSPAPTITVETSRSLTVDERNFATSRLLHRAMEQVIESRGFNEETFRILLELATRDSWEETTVVAYRLLAAHPPFRAGLRSALGNFSSDYYRVKAAWVLAMASGEHPAERRLEVERLLQTGASLSESQLAHEHFTLAAGGEVTDPLQQLASQGFEIGGIPSTDSRSIQQWARDQVSTWSATAPASVEVQAPAPLRHEGSQEPAEVGRTVEPPRTQEEQAQDKAKAERIKNRKGELYALIAKSLLAHHPDDPEVQKAAVKLVCDSKSERAVVFFLNDFPSNLTPEVRREVEALVKVSVTSEHLQALAQLFLLDPPQEADKRARAITKAIGVFLKATSTDEKVSNAEAIADITWLARNMSLLPKVCERLLTMARKRLKLYAEKLKEPAEDESDLDERISEEREEGVEVTDKQELWRKLYNQGQAHILASLSLDPQRETQFVKGVAKLKDPYLEAVAYNLRAHMLAKGPAHLELAVTYMTTAIQTLSKIEQDGVRISLGMEILGEITGHPVFGTLGSELVTHLGHPFYASEVRLAMIGQERVPQANWYAPETVPQLILDGSIVPEVMGRFVSSKQLGKLLDRRDLTPAQKAELMIGYLKNGAYQRACEYLKPLMEAEEAKAQPEYLAALDRLFLKLLSRGDSKAAYYLQERKRRILTGVHQRTLPAPFTTVERRWIDLLCDSQQGSDLVPLLYTPGLALEDRLQLLETLMSKGVVDRQLMSVYLHLKGLGQAHHFFAIIEGLNQAMPGVNISTQLVNEILRDGRIQSGEATVAEVVTAWSQMWLEFESVESPEERLHLLATNEVLADAYYRQESERYNFGGQELSFQSFLEIVRLMDSLDGHYEHSAIERYERALERAHPTIPQEKGKSLGSIEQNDNLDDEGKAFLAALADNSQTPLSEAQILKIHDIGKEAEIRHPEVLLPSNRQRIYRLYFGMTPVRAKGDYAMSRIFVRQFSPRKYKGPTYWADPSLQFRLTYEEFVRLLHTDWSIKETRRLLGEAAGKPYATEIAQELDALLASQQTQQEFVAQASRLHTRFLCEHFGLTRPQATGRIRSGRSEYFNKIILPRLVEAKSHLLASDSMLAGSAHARENVLKRNFDRILPALGHFLTKESEVTDKKAEIARRLGLPETWKGMTGDKALVEVELIADVAELDPRLRELYLGPLKDVMHRRAEDYKDVVTEKHMLIPISQMSLGRYEVRYVDKKDIYAYIRIH